jgi:dihydrofolate reductase
MRKVIASMNVTLDGCISGMNGELDWHFPLWNEEMSFHICDQLSHMDTILLGRVSYQQMAGYWPDAQTNPLNTDKELEFAHMMNTYPKIVFSTTLQKPSWNNTTLIRANIKEEILQMKKLAGRDMIIYGSGSIVKTFIQQGLIDELQIWVHPVVIQNGMPMFKNITQNIHLKLISTRTFTSGVVILYYRPVSR